MRIWDEASRKRLDGVTLFLTADEAKECKDTLVSLLQGAPNSHAHVSSSDFQTEITLCVYSVEDAETFARLDERAKRLILHDE
jgi:phage replication-related protein YjqB (UPF0714/DUF867 family)